MPAEFTKPDPRAPECEENPSTSCAQHIDRGGSGRGRHDDRQNGELAGRGGSAPRRHKQETGLHNIRNTTNQWTKQREVPAP